MKSFSLKVKLLSSYLILAFLILIVGAMGWIATTDTEKSLVTFGSETFPKVNALETIVTTLTVFQRIERTMLITEYFTDEDERSNQMKILAENWQIVDAAIADFESLPHSQAENDQWQDLKTKWFAWKKTHEHVVQLVTSVDLDQEEGLDEAREAALDYSDTEARQAVISARNVIVQMRDDIKAQAMEFQQASRKRAASYKNINLFVALAGIVGAVVFGIFISLYLSKSINAVSLDLSQSSSELSLSASQIASSSDQVAEGATSQAASLEETSASMEEISSMTRLNAEHADQANQLMQNTLKVIQKANESMDEMNDAMQGISEASDETSKIIKTIDEIAFQTNLLALNAAVEAARAGEAGAGFAIVADEVRNLALRASEAAQGTSVLIEGTVDKVHSGRKIVEKANDAFSEVSESSTKVGSLVNEIATASQDQSQGIDQIRQTLTQLDSVTMQNSALAEESAAAAIKLKQQAETLSAMSGDLHELVAGQGKIRTTEIVVYEG